jgi:hypothetical protein
LKVYFKLNLFNPLVLHLGGALGNKKPEDSAFFYRDVGFEIHAISKWEKGGVDPYRNWSRSFADKLRSTSGKCICHVC